MTDSGLNETVPHSARVWNYWLDGKDHFAADRELAEQIRTTFPGIAAVARASRQFTGRVTTFLTAEAGVRQFLDIGTGLPSADNTHEVAQRVAPESRIVYVDNDAVVLVHARALLTSTPEGATGYIKADVRDTATILREAADTLDFTQPIALMMLGILGHLDDHEEARAIVRRLVDAVPSGSYLVVCDGNTTDQAHVEAQRAAKTGGHTYHLRDERQLGEYFDGLDMVPPGLVSAPLWRPDGPAEPLPVSVGVARKP